MNEASQVQSAAAGRAAEPVQNRRESIAPAKARQATIQRESDNVEVSEAAVFLSKLREQPGIRADLVAKIRGEIARGDYDTPEKLSQAIDDLIDDVETFGQ